MFTKRFERKSKFEIKKSTISVKYVCLFLVFIKIGYCGCLFNGVIEFC